MIGIAAASYQAQGGADHVTTELARVFDAPIVTDIERQPDVPDDVETVTIDRRHGRGMLARLLSDDVAGIIDWQRVPELHEFDTVIATNHAAGWYIPLPEQRLVHYLNATPRGMTDLFNQDMTSLPRQAWATLGRMLFAQRTAADRYLVNSERTERCVRRHWRVPADDITICYPPVDVDAMATDGGVDDEGDFFVVLSRLAEEKGIGKIAHAFRESDHRLVIAGDGPLREDVEELADSHENIEFVGYIRGTEKASLLSRSRAVVTACEHESFGMVPVEAMAAGTPAVGPDAGFTKYLIDDGENGYLHDGTPKGILEACSKLSTAGVEVGRTGLRKRAQQYNRESFENSVVSAVRSL